MDETHEGPTWDGCSLAHYVHVLDNIGNMLVRCAHKYSGSIIERHTRRPVSTQMHSPFDWMIGSGMRASTGRGKSMGGRAISAEQRLRWDPSRTESNKPDRITRAEARELARGCDCAKAIRGHLSRGSGKDEG